MACFSGTAVPGDAAHGTDRGGGSWRFASAGNLAAFPADPMRVAPPHGGFRAWGVANGRLFSIDPVSGRAVEDERPFVFVNAGVKALRQADRAALFAAAETN